VRHCLAGDRLRQLHAVLRTLLDDLTGTARFSTTEDQVEVIIRLKNGKGSVEGPRDGETEFEAETDQGFLNGTLPQLRPLTARYPFRG
jgi:hypothetical protein